MNVDVIEILEDMLEKRELSRILSIEEMFTILDETESTLFLYKGNLYRITSIRRGEKGAAPPVLFFMGYVPTLGVEE